MPNILNHFIHSFVQPNKIRLEDDEEIQQERHRFVLDCHEHMLEICKQRNRNLITRDYRTIPEMLNMELVKRELMKMVKSDPLTCGYVHVWVSSGRILNWNIDYVKDRV